MKNVKHVLSTVALLMVSGVFLLTCKKENNGPEASENEVSFSISVSNLNNASTLKSTMDYSLDDVKKIVLTIVNNDGSSTKYSDAEINIFDMNGAYFSQKLTLKIGSYHLIAFYLIDANGNTIYAAPGRFSQEAQNVSEPLPIIFSISKDDRTMVPVEILSTVHHTPEQFGFNRFPILEIKTFDFLIGVAENESDNLISANLTVTSGSYSYQQSLENVSNNIVTIRDNLSNYLLNVHKDGYFDYTFTFTHDSLIKYQNIQGNLPLSIELDKNTLTDYDGNVYNAVKIGDQIWMAENLKTIHFKDGTPITLVTDYNAWWNDPNPAYCWYNNDEATYRGDYGALYNWYSVNTGKLCPTGWHMPSDDEWTTMVNFLGGNSVAGGMLKEAGNSHWASPNSGADNSTGFTALSGGARAYWTGNFLYINTTGFYWSATENDAGTAKRRLMWNDSPNISNDVGWKSSGGSVRCLKN
jgi:uncharacterized protein (TIGR02145 family)